MPRHGQTAALLSLALAAVSCRHTGTIDYRHADGAADARRALMDSGHFHVLAVRVGDSVISPSDTTAYKQRSVNVQAGPEDPVVYLPVSSDPSRPGWPSSTQISYMKAYNTELFALLDTNLMRAHSPLDGGTAAAPPPLAADSAPAPQGTLALDEGAFGLSNSDGTRLITMDSVATPSQIHWAICNRGHLYHIRFVHAQAGVPDSASPQTAGNFGHLTGDVFAAADTIHPAGDDDCYLTADTSLVRSVTPILAGPTSDCSGALRVRLSEAKHREVVHCWQIARTSSSVISAAQFVTQDSSALASIVVAAGGQLLFEDFPATYRGPDESTWRVDDGGQFSPENFSVLFLGQVRGTWVMGLTWLGAEGVDDYVLFADSASSFREAEKTYRYVVPN